MVEINPEGTAGTGGEEKVELSKADYNALVEAKATDAQAKASMTEELKDLRKKNQELAGQSQVQTEDVSKVVEKEFEKRETESRKANQDTALAQFLDAHSEFSKETDTDGSKFAAFQAALARLSTVGCKTVGDFSSVLQDALSLMERKAETRPFGSSSTQPSVVSVQGQKTTVRLTDKEAKLVETRMNGDVEAFLKIKAKRPAYVEELLNWVK